jgi:hypothetical protein
MSQQRKLWFRLALAIALSAFPALGCAQNLGVSGGLAMPLGSLGEYRSIGIRGQLSAFSPGGLLRVDLGGVLLPGGADPRVSTWRTGTWRSVSVAGNVLPLLSRSESLNVRGLVGGSVHWMSVRGEDNPYGMVPGLQIGALWERPWNGRALTAEFGLHTVISDYGVDEYGASYSLPLLVGIRW